VVEKAREGSNLEVDQGGNGLVSRVVELGLDALRRDLEGVSRCLERGEREMCVREKVER